ncbi:hypothetical protein CT0861_09394 [Colletotrichum tofieldiae]|uniref:Uncharacterized protein n=1 Tax=Colletotrichum tofieldiae TaxID=708197 RepID=A0A166TVT1_9PEZI|nr:hypothetical protein CT0861_09394 [Colletotrichum tofieldiae]
MAKNDEERKGLESAKDLFLLYQGSNRPLDPLFSNDVKSVITMNGEWSGVDGVYKPRLPNFLQKTRLS